MVMTLDETQVQIFADWPVSHVVVNKTIAQAQELERNIFGHFKRNKEETGIVEYYQCNKEMTSVIE